MLPLDRHLAEVVRRHDREDVTDAEPLIGGLDEPPGADDRPIREPQEPCVQGVRGAVHHLQEGHAVLLQFLRVHVNLHLLQPLAPDRYVRDTGNAKQARPDLPVGDRRHLDQGQALGREPDLHDPARGRQGLDHHGRCRPCRQRRCDRRNPLLNELTGTQEVGPSLEENLDRRELGNRFRANRLEARQSLERLLERNGDESFRLLGREPDGHGLDLDPWLRELGEDVHRCVAQGPEAEDHHRQTPRDHDEAEPEARADDPAHHRRRAPVSLNARHRRRTRRRTAQARLPSPPSCRAPAPSRAPRDPHRCGRRRSALGRRSALRD